MDLNVLIVGGGIHGVGLLHDLATRGVHAVHLVEQSKLASGTSSRTTKLIHGGLRYLEHLGQWGLVREGPERTRIAPTAATGHRAPTSLSPAGLQTRQAGLAHPSRAHAL
ncbi:FAD-dependent oxidoreductase [Nitrospira tepida]|uniref:FAD-dependent oxidoreductase n=1 Tax=Nitrospira tepida TaxID=2973512 RepID=UPI00351E8BB1